MTSVSCYDWLRLMGQLTAYFKIIPIIIIMAIDIGKAYRVIESLFWAYTLCTQRYYLTSIQVLSNDNAGKNKSYEKTNSEFVEFVSIPRKLIHSKIPTDYPQNLWGFITVPIPIPYPYPWESPWESPYQRQPCLLVVNCNFI